jgi:hypothetical protein
MVLSFVNSIEIIIILQDYKSYLIVSLSEKAKIILGSYSRAGERSSCAETSTEKRRRQSSDSAETENHSRRSGRRRIGLVSIEQRNSGFVFQPIR